VSSATHIIGGLDTSFGVSAQHRKAAELLEKLWAPNVTRAEDTVRADYVIQLDEDFWTLRAEGMNIAVGNISPWPVFHQLRGSVSQRALMAAADVTGLHGAALVRDGSALILSGPTQVGKTTLTVELAERGWSVLSDDLAVLSHTSGRLRTFAKPFHIRDASLWKRLSSGWSFPEWLPPPDEASLVPASAVGVWKGADVVPMWLIFPSFLPQSAPVFRNLSSAEAVGRCHENFQNPRDADASDVRAFARLCKAVSVAEASYQSTEQAIEMVHKLVD
jgi:hypothetical protein